MAMTLTNIAVPRPKSPMSCWRICAPAKICARLGSLIDVLPTPSAVEMGGNDALRAAPGRPEWALAHRRRRVRHLACARTRLSQRTCERTKQASCARIQSGTGCRTLANAPLGARPRRESCRGKISMQRTGSSTLSPRRMLGCGFSVFLCGPFHGGTTGGPGLGRCRLGLLTWGPHGAGARRKGPC